MQENEKQKKAETWFCEVRDLICESFEKIERENGSDACFVRKSWERSDTKAESGGGGVMSVMRGTVFEKVGVNVSTVHGCFEPDFAKTIPGAQEDPSFFATGISVVSHMCNPHVPGIHINTRFLSTTKHWFGGGIDLNPPIPYAEDTKAFKQALQETCDHHDPTYWKRFSAWCDDYFFLKHRGITRGVGGIFYDYINTGSWDKDFAFTQDVGRIFLDIYPRLVRARMDSQASAEDRQRQLAYRGLYTEFNLLWDRGTLFGLKTGGNVEAVLMSLPPLAAWP